MGIIIEKKILEDKKKKRTPHHIIAKMSKVPRDVSSIIQKLRQVFNGGREFKSHVRFEGKNFEPRTQPKPNLPNGVSHKLANNYYFGRDARRTSMPNQTIYVAGQQSVAAAKPAPQLEKK